MLGNLGNAVSAITDGKGDGESLVNLVREEAVRCLEAAGLPLEDRETMTRRVSAHPGQESQTRIQSAHWDRVGRAWLGDRDRSKWISSTEKSSGWEGFMEFQLPTTFCCRESPTRWRGIARSRGKYTAEEPYRNGMIPRVS